MATSLPYWDADSHNARADWRIMAPGSDSLPVEWVHGMAVHLATPNSLFSPLLSAIIHTLIPAQAASSLFSPNPLMACSQQDSKQSLHLR